METFTIQNITETDVKKKRIRILTANRKLFPSEIKGEPQTYNINIVFNEISYSTTYKTGSRDGLSRSGIIKNNFCPDLKPGAKLAFQKISDKAFHVKVAI